MIIHRCTVILPAPFLHSLLKCYFVLSIADYLFVTFIAMYFYHSIFSILCCWRKWHTMRLLLVLLQRWTMFFTSIRTTNSRMLHSVHHGGQGLANDIGLEIYEKAILENCRRYSLIPRTSLLRTCNGVGGNVLLGKLVAALST